jgi:hypothetical protein
MAVEQHGLSDRISALDSTELRKQFHKLETNSANFDALLRNINRKEDALSLGVRQRAVNVIRLALLSLFLTRPPARQFAQPLPTCSATLGNEGPYS